MRLNRGRNPGFRLVSLLLSGLVLAGCQGGINHGTSSHVSSGSAAPMPPPAPRMTPPPSRTPVAVPVERPRPVEAPAANATRVQVLPANPQQGIPLGDDTELKIESLNPPARPVVPDSSAVPVPAPLIPVASDAGTDQDVAASWLDRYPNLAEDLQNPREVLARLEQEVKVYQEQLAGLQQQVSRRWGSNAVVATSPHQFVKYTDAYQSRGRMDFDQGVILVETVDPSNPRERLRKAIVTTLLTPYDADNPELYSDKAIDYSGPSLLAGQVLDHEGQPVRWAWRANRYAEYLVDNKVEMVERGGQTVYRVEIPLIANHSLVRGMQYEHLVRDAGRRYGVDETLIYAIMETESQFNPYATSHVPAYGLMQVVPSTAGRDVFERVKQRSDQPSRSYLFDPANNIDTGVAYISLLRDVYLKDVRHPLSKEYAIIAGYNGGAGNVLRTFHRDRREAVNVINQLTPQQVYDRLHRQHPSAESRRYILKVSEAQQRYRSLASSTL